jgi:hypothetical protein
MNEDLRRQLAGRVPLVLLFDDIPTPQGDQLPLVVLTQPFHARVNIEGLGAIEADGFRLTKRQAIDLAVRLTEIVGPLDSES